MADETNGATGAANAAAENNGPAAAPSGDQIGTQPAAGTAPADTPTVGEVIAAGQVVADTVDVRPLRPFKDDGVFRAAGGPSFTVPRSHAAELRANKLVEYVDPEDDQSARKPVSGKSGARAKPPRKPAAMPAGKRKA